MLIDRYGQEEIREYYVRVVEPLLGREGEAHWGATLSGYCHAYGLVSSRAFLVDAYHGLAMVPVADG
jgi:hypothetical protein